MVLPPVRLTSRGVDALRHNAVPVDLEVDSFRQSGAGQCACRPLVVQVPAAVVAARPRGQGQRKITNQGDSFSRSPPLRGSMSITSSESGTAAPIIASGQRCHRALITSGSMVAS